MAVPCAFFAIVLILLDIAAGGAVQDLVRAVIVTSFGWAVQPTDTLHATPVVAYEQAMAEQSAWQYAHLGDFSQRVHEHIARQRSLVAAAEGAWGVSLVVVRTQRDPDTTVRLLRDVEAEVLYSPHTIHSVTVLDTVAQPRSAACKEPAVPQRPDHASHGTVSGLEQLAALLDSHKADRVGKWARSLGWGYICAPELAREPASAGAGGAGGAGGAAPSVSAAAWALHAAMQALEAEESAAALVVVPDLVRPADIFLSRARDSWLLAQAKAQQAVRPSHIRSPAGSIHSTAWTEVGIGVMPLAAEPLAGIPSSARSLLSPPGLPSMEVSPAAVQEDWDLLARHGGFVLGRRFGEACGFQYPPRMTGGPGVGPDQAKVTYTNLRRQSQIAGLPVVRPPLDAALVCAVQHLPPQTLQVAVTRSVEQQLASQPFVDGTAAAVLCGAAAGPIHVGMASQPRRVGQLKHAVASLAGQVDQLTVYLNGYGAVPRFLQGAAWLHPVLDSSTPHGDLGDAGKFYGLGSASQESWYFTADDDVWYAPNYARRSLYGQLRYGGTAVTSMHGGTFRRTPGPYRTARVFNARVLDSLPLDVPVQAVGTGVAAMRITTPPVLSISLDDFLAPNMADVWLSVAASRQGVPLVVLAHPTDWLLQLPVPAEDTIWRQSISAGAAVQTRVIQTTTWITHAPQAPAWLVQAQTALPTQATAPLCVPPLCAHFSRGQLAGHQLTSLLRAVAPGFLPPGTSTGVAPVSHTHSQRLLPPFAAAAARAVGGLTAYTSWTHPAVPLTAISTCAMLAAGRGLWSPLGPANSFLLTRGKTFAALPLHPAVAATVAGPGVVWGPPPTLPANTSLNTDVLRACGYMPGLVEHPETARQLPADSQRWVDSVALLSARPPNLASLAHATDSLDLEERSWAVLVAAQDALFASMASTTPNVMGGVEIAVFSRGASLGTPQTSASASVSGGMLAQRLRLLLPVLGGSHAKEQPSQVQAVRVFDVDAVGWGGLGWSAQLERPVATLPPQLDRGSAGTPRLRSGHGQASKQALSAPSEELVQVPPSLASVRVGTFMWGDTAGSLHCTVLAQVLGSIAPGGILVTSLPLLPETSGSSAAVRPEDLADLLECVENPSTHKRSSEDPSSPRSFIQSGSALLQVLQSGPQGMAVKESRSHFSLLDAAAFTVVVLQKASEAA